eukprot:TRINITY_DN6762_c0_g1_i2.p1 TRINITY_DN6762_c0_g1~~TRINITY_DN6762_c0_g1_i2.p1  ORF type:complete len:146 (+),score=36.05 TRINITY_DN6762_c0_g1_i2:72-509(+)
MKGLSIRDPLRFIEQTDALHLNERRFKYVQSRFQIELTKQNGRLQVAPKSRDSPSIHALAEYLCLFTSPQHIFTINAAVISGENFFLAAEEAENLFGLFIQISTNNTEIRSNEGTVDLFLIFYDPRLKVSDINEMTNIRGILRFM